MMYNLLLTRQAVKDAQKLEYAGLKPRALVLLRTIRKNPFQNPPPYEKPRGFENAYARRINIQYRLVCQITPNENNEKNGDGMVYQGMTKIIRMWTHYE